MAFRLPVLGLDKEKKTANRRLAVVADGLKLQFYRERVVATGCIETLKTGIAAISTVGARSDGIDQTAGNIQAAQAVPSVVFAVKQIVHAGADS